MAVQPAHVVGEAHQHPHHCGCGQATQPEVQEHAQEQEICAATFETPAEDHA